MEIDASRAAAQVPFATNVTCNRTCVFELEENAFFNLEDSVLTRGRSTYIANDPELVQARPLPPGLCWLDSEDYFETAKPNA